MKRSHIALLTALLVFVSCGRARVIPRKTFSEVFARMLLADQQVRYDADPNMSLIADTTLFYEPILEEYGYTKADYVKSVGKYMEDPEKFADIFKESKKILDDHIFELTAEKRRVAKQDSLARVYASMTFLRPPIYRDIARDSIRLDTVSVELDSNGIFSWERIRPDTLYYGPRFVVKVDVDSLQQANDVAAEAKKPEVKKPEVKAEKVSNSLKLKMPELPKPAKFRSIKK